MRPMMRVSLIVLAGLVAASAQVTTEDYNQLLSQSAGYLKERRFHEALAVLKKAYNARPSPGVLGRMALAHMAAGQFTEAQEAATRALAQGGEITLTVRHMHGRGHCVGPLTFGPEYVTWAGQDASDSFRVKYPEIERIEKFESAYSGGLREEGRGGIPEFRLRTEGKNWRFEYLLYGEGQYEVDGHSILYTGADLPKADSANRLIIEWLQRRGAVEPLPAAGNRVEITKGMSREDVVRLLGEPARVVVFGGKTTLRYSDMTVELEDGKVVDVRVH